MPMITFAFGYIWWQKTFQFQRCRSLAMNWNSNWTHPSDKREIEIVFSDWRISYDNKFATLIYKWYISEEKIQNAGWINRRKNVISNRNGHYILIYFFFLSVKYVFFSGNITEWMNYLVEHKETKNALHVSAFVMTLHGTLLLRIH